MNENTVPPASDNDAEASNFQEYVCPEPDEPDYFAEEVQAHRRMHQAASADELTGEAGAMPDPPPEAAERLFAALRGAPVDEPASYADPAWGDVDLGEVWRAAVEIPGVLDAFAAVASIPPADVARVLRRIADVLDVLDGGTA